MARFEVNGQQVTVHQNDQTPLIDALRNALGLRATRLGCGLGQCGACHVMVDGQSVPACDTPLWAVQDKHVMTVESAKDPQQDAPRHVLRQLQEAFVQEQAAQCGFCTSGILMSATVLLQQHAEPSLAQIHAALDRHLCRCGAHLRIVRAIQRAAQALRKEVAA
jgi:nicotinate dehydrogenase subunit A